MALAMDSGAAIRLIEDGLKEEMMVVMLDMLQAAAQACAKVCAQRLHEQQRLMVRVWQEAEARQAGEQPATMPACEVAAVAAPAVGPGAGEEATAAAPGSRRVSFQQLLQDASPACFSVGDADDRGDVSGSGDLEVMYEDLDKSVANLRAALLGRRRALREVGVYESDDDEAFESAFSEGMGGLVDAAKAKDGTRQEESRRSSVVSVASGRSARSAAGPLPSSERGSWPGAANGHQGGGSGANAERAEEAEAAASSLAS